MTTTLELINAIASGDATQTEAAFGSAMAEKISSKLDDMRVQIAQNMFNAVDPSTTEVDTSAAE